MDTYIEEVIIKLDELLERASCACDGRLPHGVHYVLADVNHGKDGEEIRDLLRTALGTQKAATKTQHIKDIEEIEALFENDVRSLIPKKKILSVLTFRKAAIEEV